MSTPHSSHSHSQGAPSSSNANAKANADEASSIEAKPIDPTWDLYSLLSLSGEAPLSPSSSLKDLSRAYRTKAKALHPDRNPDPQAKHLFQQLQLVFEYIEDPERRRAYDARILAARARAQKDAAMDQALQGMKKDLERREAEAMAARVHAREAQRNKERQGGQVKSAEEITREANEALIRRMAQQLDPANSSSSSSSLNDDSHVSQQRSAKSQRVSATDSSVHAGNMSSNGVSAAHGTESSSDEKSRTLSLRFSKSQPQHDPSQATYSGPSLQSILTRYGSVQHVIFKADKKKAMIVMATVTGARAALAALSAADSQYTREWNWDVKMLDSSKGEETHSKPAQSTSTTAFATSATPASSSSSASTTATATTNSFEFGVGASAALTPEEYEAATMRRMAAIAKQKKLKREQEAAAAAAAAAAQ